MKKQTQSPVERQIFLKERLIRSLNKEISEIREECEAKIGKIKFRIEMAQVLLDAFKKGKS